MSQGESRTGETKRGGEITPSRIGLAVGATGLAAATAFMNVSAWVGQGATLSDRWINAAISGSLEVIGITAIAWAGHQASKQRSLRAGLAAIAGAGAIYFNTQASIGFFEAQETAGANRIEQAGASVETDAARIARLDAEIAAIREQNGGVLPRNAAAIESAYAHLDPARNPLNMARRDAELALRREYERVAGEIDALRAARAQEQVIANDAYRPVIPADQRLVFIWAVEAFKGAAFFLLGTGQIGRRRKEIAQAPTSYEVLSDDHQAQAPVLSAQPISFAKTLDAPAAQDTMAFNDAARGDHDKRKQNYAIARRKGWRGRAPRP